MKQEKSKAITIPFIGGDGVMPITGYFGPYLHEHDQLPYYFTDEIFEFIADAGINLMVYSAADYATHPELVKQNLERGEKYRVGVLVTDSSLVERKEEDAITVEEAEKKITSYKDYKAFCGMYIIDEPTTSYFCMGDGSRLISKYKNVSEILQNALNQLCYINLLPIYNFESETRANYERYVNEFCDELQPKVVMWDYYPFDKYREGKMEVYFYNMNVIREAALKRNLPFWAFVQAGAQWNDGWNQFKVETPYYPNESQFYWNVNTSLAFGAQGIQYFPLLQPAQFTLAEGTEGDYECNGIIGAMVNKTQWYYYAQKINKHIAAIDEVLMNSVHKGVIASGEQATKDLTYASCVIQEGCFEQLKSVEGNTMVGCFNYQGKAALYVVNYSFEHAQSITLELNRVWNLTVIRNAKKTVVTTERLSLDMEAGEGILIVIQ